MNLDPTKRPTLAEVALTLKAISRESQAELQKVDIPSVESLFDLDKLIQQKLHRIWGKCDPFFTEERTKDEQDGVYGWSQENMKAILGVRKDFRLAKPLPLTEEYETEGDICQRYLGTFRKKPNGRGTLMNDKNTELFEGFFKDGQKHGPFRSIAMSTNSHMVTITEGIYSEGELTAHAQTLVQVLWSSDKKAPPVNQFSDQMQE